MPLLKPFAMHNRLLLQSPLLESQAVSKYSRGRLRQAFANRIMEKHQLGVVPAIRLLYYLRWLRPIAAYRMAVTSKFDLSLWINLLSGVQVKQAQFKFVSNKLKLLKNAGKRIIPSVCEAEFIPRLTAVVGQLVHSKQIAQQSDIRRLFVREPHTFVSAQVNRFSYLTSFFNNFASFARQEKSYRHNAGPNSSVSSDQFLQPAFMLSRTHGNEFYSAGSDTVPVLKSNEGHLVREPRTFVSAPANRFSHLTSFFNIFASFARQEKSYRHNAGPNSSVSSDQFLQPAFMLGRTHGIPCRAPIATKIETDRNIKVNRKTGYEKGHLLPNWREFIPTLPIWQQLAGKRHRVTPHFVSKREPLVTLSLARAGGYAHPVGRLHPASDANLKAHYGHAITGKPLFIDATQASDNLLSDTPVMSPRTVKPASKESLAQQAFDQPLTNNFRSIRSLLQRHAGKLQYDTSSNDNSVALYYPSLNSAQVQSKEGKSASNLHQAVHGQDIMATTDISQVSRSITGNSVKTVNTQLLADQVYGIILERVKTELRMRGR